MSWQKPLLIWKKDPADSLSFKSHGDKSYRILVANTRVYAWFSDPIHDVIWFYLWRYDEMFQKKKKKKKKKKTKTKKKKEGRKLK